MGYEYAAPLDEALWPVVHSELVGDSGLALVTYGPRATSHPRDTGCLTFENASRDLAQFVRR